MLSPRICAAIAGLARDLGRGLQRCLRRRHEQRLAAGEARVAGFDAFGRAGFQQRAQRAAAGRCHSAPARRARRRRWSGRERSARRRCRSDRRRARRTAATRRRAPGRRARRDARLSATTDAGARNSSRNGRPAPRAGPRSTAACRPASRPAQGGEQSRAAARDQGDDEIVRGQAADQVGDPRRRLQPGLVRHRDGRPRRSRCARRDAIAETGDDEAVPAGRSNGPPAPAPWRPRPCRRR